jgi:hypothetical protein
MSSSLELLDELGREHELLDRLAGALWTWADHDRPLVADGAAFARVLELWLVGFHHHREEETLFRALVDDAELPADRGPLAVLRGEHRGMAELVQILGADDAAVVVAARTLARDLWEHLDKENSVLFPEARRRLRRAAVTTLVGRPPTADEIRSEHDAEDLIRRYPPTEDPDMVRGDGCIPCRAFTVECAGIEGEWWNSWETEYRRTLQE